MVHPSHVFEHAATPHADTRIITKANLAELRDAIRGFIKAVASQLQQIDSHKISEMLVQFSLSADKFIGAYTTKYRVK